MNRLLLVCGATFVVAEPIAAQAARQAPGTDIAAATRDMQRHDGFMPVILDSDGRILLELPRDSTRALAFFTLATGLGSNAIGLDRGANGPEHVVRFDRNGSRVNVVFENWGYRTSSGNPDHERTIAESFPHSTVASLPLLAAQGGRLLVDATDFLLRDWSGIAQSLQGANQGSYSLDRQRSAVYRPLTRAWPANTEIDVSLTFTTSGRPGGIMNQILADGSAFTLRQHLSLLPLPDAGYRPRRFDPRTGFFGITFRDYAQPLQGSLEQRWIARHRLERAEPSNPRSTITNPIVYYVDRGMPEPIRTATLEGARWWEEAFAQAGLPGGFRVELMPEGADPMDARYNVVQWENRHERGWSIGGSMGDPRTGQIIKAMARMDSHRARTDYQIYAALIGADAAAADTAFVLARVRQVTAHEIGHTLGIAHNYIASTYDRGSVMDYPPPRVSVRPDGSLDISQAYSRGPGPWDVWAVRWGYGIFPPGTEDDSLRAIVADGLARGMLFLSDADARPDFASDPRTNLWDDAATAAAYMQRMSEVRRVATSRFGLRNIREGEPVALLQDRFSYVYFWHRFAAVSLAKAVGGMEYHNAIRGDGQAATRWVEPARQREALALLVAAIEPGELDIPDTVLALMGPRPYGIPPAAELFASRARPAFDLLGAAQSLSDLVIGALLQRDRAARLVQQSIRTRGALSLEEVIDALSARSFRNVPGEDDRRSALRRVAARALTDRLLALAADRDAASEVRALAELKLSQLMTRARTLGAAGRDTPRATWLLIASDARRWLERRELPQPAPALRLPQYDPYGTTW